MTQRVTGVPAKPVTLSTVTESRRWSVEEGWRGKESLTLKVFEKGADVCLKALVHCP